VEAVEVAAGFLEVFDPFLGLGCEGYVSCGWQCLWGQAGSLTSAIIIWQSNVPFPPTVFGRSTWERIFVTTGAPKVRFGTKCASIMSM
jgi:hypothetical protein